MILPKWQYISQGKTPEMQFNHAKNAIGSGCKWVQLRIKNKPQEVILQTALKLKPVCAKHKALLMINDNVQIALETKADGVHLGKKDMPPSRARKILGEETIIGGTANTFEDIQYLNEQGVNYIGLGPFRFTSTKKNLSPILGISGYLEIVENMKKHHIQIPVFAIGGILLEDIEVLMETGIHGIAVSGLVTHSKKKETLIQEINLLLKNKLTSL